jgi:LuxR family maltose regulon positive regulatory protein
MSAPILATKLYIPPPRPGAVPRPRLLERLNEGLRQDQGSARKLTLISAPAGFGKTALAATWVAGFEQNEPKLRVAWLSLEEADGEPARFLAYLITALQTIVSDLGAGVLVALQAPQPPLEVILTALLNEIAAIPADFVLVLDDYHLVDSQQVDQAVAFLVEHLPPQMHLIIATREDPHLPLSRLRARGQLTELRAADLRFTSAEAAEFLNQVMGLNLPAEDIAALETRTEGWIAGLQLAALSMQGQKDATGFIKSFTGSHHFVLDYLMEEVLQQQPEGVKTFLLRTSILERLCGSLCDAVLQGDHDPTSSASGQETLEYLEHANLFNVPLDNERRWYRYHHLFAELLRHRLEQTSPALAPELHRRASVWLESENLIEEAVAHAFASRDWEHTANLIYHFAHRVHIQTNLTTLGGWLAALPEPVMRARPWLCVYQALAWYWTGPRDRIEEYLQLAEQALPGSQMPEAEATHLAGYIAAVRAHYALVSGNIPRVLAMAQAALQQLPEGDYMRGWTAVALGGAYWGQGNVVASQQAFQTAKTVALQHNYRFRAVAPACYVGMQLVKQGKLDEALCVYREGVEYATVAGGQQLPIAGFPKVKLGDVLRERNDLPGADQWLRPGVEQCLQLGHPDVLADAYAALARLQLAQNDWPGAYATFQKADELAQKSPVDPFVRCWLDDCRVRLWLAKGRLDDLTRWAEASGLTVDGELSYHYDLHQLNLARLLLARARRAATPAGAHACLSQVSSLLARLLVAAEKAGWVHESIKSLVLQALVSAESSDKDMALRAVGRALALAEPGGFIRLFVDEGEPMRSLIADYCCAAEKQSRDRVHPQSGYLDILLAAFVQPAAKPQSATTSGVSTRESAIVEPLSQRELEILRLIAQGLSNQEIGARLFLALNTVKGHNRVIFDKLQVERRTEAIARARELGLLEK